MSKVSNSAKTHPPALLARRSALEALVERERVGVVERLSWTRPRVDAEDIYQEACLRALEHLTQLQRPEYLRAWFSAVLRTVVSRSPGNDHHVAPVEVRDNLAVETPPFLCGCGFEALAALAKSQQELIHDVVIGGLTTERVAREAHTTTNNIRVRLHRARAQLRTRWERECGSCIRTGQGSGCACSSARDAKGP